MAYKSKNSLYKTNRGAKIGGVCAGISECFKIDITIVRALFIVLSFAVGSAVLLYLILWVVLPEESKQPEQPEESEQPEQ